MPSAQATTDGSGRRLVGGIDFHNMSSRVEYGDRVDPWERMKDPRGKRSYEMGRITANGFPSYNLLINYITREIKPHLSETVEICTGGRARQITLRGVRYMSYLGNIYKKDVEPINCIAKNTNRSIITK